MRILPIKIELFREKELKKENNSENKINKENDNTTKLNDMPDYRYMINFRGNNENLDKLYEKYGRGNGMPITFDKYLSTLSWEKREQRKDTYAAYRSVYSEMENCHNVEELKNAYPREFSKIISALDVPDIKGSFLTKLKAWSKLFKEAGEYMFPETKDNDFSVYLAKKVYLEAKTKQEIQEDFITDINRDIIKDKDLEELKSSLSKKEDKDIIPESVYERLGLTTDVKSSAFRNSLCMSRKDYIQKYGSIYKAKRKENFEKVLKELVDGEDVENVSIPRKNSSNYEKLQYTMFYVWNNSLELRRAMSDFLINKREDVDLLSPDLLEMREYNNKSEYSTKQHLLMKEFWRNYPEYRQYFSEKCKEAFDVIEFTIDNGTFDILKDDIDKKRISTYLLLKEEKEAKERELRKKIEEEQKEALFLRKKELLGNEIIRTMRALKEERAIPNSYINQITETIRETGRKLNKEESNVSEIEKEIEYIFNYTSAKAKIALNSLLNEITKLNKGDFEKRAKKSNIAEEYINKYGADNIDVIKNEKIPQDLAMVSKVFSRYILEKYIIYIQKFHNGEAPRDERKKKINELIENLKNMPTYSKVFDFKIKRVILEELSKQLFNVPPKQLLSMYQRIFAQTEPQPDEIGSDYKYSLVKNN